MFKQLRFSRAKLERYCVKRMEIEIENYVEINFKVAASAAATTAVVHILSLNS